MTKYAAMLIPFLLLAYVIVGCYKDPSSIPYAIIGFIAGWILTKLVLRKKK